MTTKYRFLVALALGFAAGAAPGPALGTPLRAALGAGSLAAQEPEPADSTGVAPAVTPGGDPAAVPRRVGTMSDLMVHVIYPASDAVFYIETRTPGTDAEWGVLEGRTLMLAEAANLLMMPERARDAGQWMIDAKLMLDAGEAAYRAAKRRDVGALIELNDALYTSCVQCHRHYRPDYGRRPGGPSR